MHSMPSVARLFRQAPTNCRALLLKTTYKEKASSPLYTMAESKNLCAFTLLNFFTKSRRCYELFGSRCAYGAVSFFPRWVFFTWGLWTIGIVLLCLFLVLLLRLYRCWDTYSIMYMHTETHIYVYIYMCVYICVYTHTHIYIYIYTYINMYMHMYIYVYIYLYTYI